MYNVLSVQKKVNKSNIALLFVALLAQASFAEEANVTSISNDAVQIDEIKVVSASGFEQKITDAPATVSVITRKQLEENRYTNIGEALEDMEGVDVRMSNTGKTGGLSVSIRGMGSDYTLILIDGKRQNPAGSVTPNGFGETSNNFMPPMSAIERIEVIKGPMSTLYGSDAMGGVINIITRKVSNEWTGSISGDYTFNEHSGFGDSRGTSVYLSGPILKEKLGVALRGNIFNRDSSSLNYSDGGAVSQRGPAPVEGRRYSVGGKLTFTPADNHEFWLDGDISRQWYNNDKAQLGTLDFATNPNVASGYKEDLRFNKEQISAGYNAEFDIGRVETSILRSQTETIGRTLPGTKNATNDWFMPTHPEMGKIGDDRTLKGTNTIFDAKFLTTIQDAHYLIVGGQWWKAEVEDGIATSKFEQKTWSLFAEDEWVITDGFALIFGGRYDHHDAFGSEVSPRIYAVWNPLEEWTFKGGVSKGYKAPTVNDLHDGINSVSGQGTNIQIGSPDLKPETSLNYEAGVYYNANNGFKTNVTFFYNQFDDKIATGDNVQIIGRPDIPDGNYSQKINVDEAITKGIEAAMTIPFTNTISLGLNYTYTDSEQKSGKDKGAKLTNTPEHMANAVLNWQATSKFRTWFKMEYRGERTRFTNKYANLSPANKLAYDQLGNEVDDYTLFHLGGRYQVTKDLSISATIYNLFDKDFLKRETYYNAANVLTYYNSPYSMEGRRLWLSFTYNF